MESKPDASEVPADPRVYFAAERTLLAWIRTGLAMMGFGFVVARFGLFLHEMAAVHDAVLPAQRGLSLWFGTALVTLGVVVNVAAAWMQTRTFHRLDQGQPVHFRVLSLGTVVALLLGAFGLAMVAYLLWGLADVTP